MNEAKVKTNLIEKKFLSIVGSQIEIEKIFSLVDMLTNLWRCHLHTNNLERFIFVSKNW
jgi:hypothetical protein